MHRRQYLGGLGGALAVSLAGCAGDESTDEPDLPFEREIDPSGTYLRTNNDDAGDAQPIDLDGRAITPGTDLRLERTGSFTGSSGGTGMTGLFSSSDTLRAGDTRERVPDAIDAGDDYETSATYNGEQATDVPEDFLIADDDGEQSSVTVTVPDSATHLFVAAIDNLYEDNGQGDPPFTLRVEAP